MERSDDDEPAALPAVTGAPRNLTGWLARPLTIRDPLRRAEVIVVPGARIHPDGTLSRSAQERVRAAAELHLAGWAPLVLLSGGAPDDGPVEALTMAAEAQRLGVPAASLLLETTSKTSWENADFTAALLHQRRLTTAIVVTHGFHTRRMKRALLRRGILARAWPVPASWMARGGPAALELVVREYVALAIDITGGRR